MITFINSRIVSLTIHYVGNKIADQKLRFSDSAISLDQKIADLLTHYFVSNFKNDEFYHFVHETDINLNDTFVYVSKIFDDAKDLEPQSKNIARHLYNHSTHPKVKGGEFYTVLLQNCNIDGDIYDVVGLFKSENKDTFLKVYPKGNNYNIETDTGININKLDKGCLIFNNKKEDGYRILIVDNTNKSNEAKYWTDDFLQVKRLNDSYNQTQNALAMCKSFISQLPDDVSKSDKAAMMNRVIEGMKSENVVLEDLAAHAFGQDIASSGFKAFKDDYEAMHDVRFDQSFQSKPEAIKRRATGSMTTIKLDKNFDVCIHGGEQFIEQGYDEEKGMRYYKLYFNEEK